MSGRTKKTAHAIASALTNYEVTFVPIELPGNFFQRIQVFDDFEKGNFSLIENELNSLDAANFDLIFFGMPTYGNKPPGTFHEIMKRMKNFSGKKVIMIEAVGAQVINQHNFKRFFWIGKKKAIQFGKEINEL
ncbi:MAG: flavodoxin family protein [Candidatus Heimdallarchaeota archaeon]